jgi:RpiR family carbohydrate utilization transcriptional regulator
MEKNTDNLLHQVSRKVATMSPALKGVAMEILENPEEVQSLSITELANRAGVADSTVSRFLREMNLDGYNSLRLGIAQAIYSKSNATEPTNSSWVYEGVLEGDTLAQIMEKILYGSNNSLERTKDRINPVVISSLVDRIYEAPSVYFSAMGSSATSAESAMMRFVRAGKKCHFFRDQSVQSMGAATLKEGDLLVAISDSGDSIPVISSSNIAKNHGASVAVLTSNPDSPLAALADYLLLTGSTVANSDVYGESVTSKWGQLFAIDVLYATYATRYFEETASFLQETYLTAIKSSRSDK